MPDDPTAPDAATVKATPEGRPKRRRRSGVSVMQDGDYLPASDFLVSLMNEEIPIDDTDFGRANLSMLIAMTRDADASNRDWAAMLLSDYGPPTDEVRSALLAAAEDENQFVRGEAIEGLVDRDREKALALVKRELSANFATVPVLYSAIALADPSLLSFLEPYADPSGDSFVDGLVLDAIRAVSAQ